MSENTDHDEAPTGKARPGQGTRTVAGRGVSLFQGLRSPEDLVTTLSGIGPAAAGHLATAGIRTLGSLLMYFPRRHQEVQTVERPSEDLLGRFVRIAGRVERVQRSFLPGRRSLVTVLFVANDLTPFRVGFWNQPWATRRFEKGMRRVVQGRLALTGSNYILQEPQVLAPGADTTASVLLRYGEVEGVSDARLRRFIAAALEEVDLAAFSLPALPALPVLPGLAAAPGSVPEALVAMHHPRTVHEHEAARRFFAMHEVVALFRRLDLARLRRRKAVGPRIVVDDAVAARIAARIPFDWTGDQAAAVEKLRKALAGPEPMGFLLQGDVGTGKTAVALYAALATIAAGRQVAFLAPTELLAEQHCTSISAWLAGSAVRIALLTGQQPARVRASLDAEVASNSLQLVFGTHALLSERTRFADLGLVIIDEQHRFGVEQRASLVAKGRHPHVLVLSATPIPRTLSLALFGDLETLILRDRPAGRNPPKAVYVAPRQWPRLVKAMQRHVRRGGRVYVVCPKVGEDGGKGGAFKVHAALSGRLRCGLVHGRMATAERLAATRAFRAGTVDVLVGTTVLEVGLDVAEATLIVVVGADKFGLSTLHQLRGRVGRGGRRGLCVLTGLHNERIQALCRTTDGFALAETDLRLRGAGELFGTRQSGVGELRAFDPVTDLDLLLALRRGTGVRQDTVEMS